MPFPSSGNTEVVTNLLKESTRGNREALDQITPIVFSELHEMATSFMKKENSDHTLQATSLISEAFIRLIDQDRVDWRNKAHFMAISAQMMRRILIDHARSKKRLKRGGNQKRIALDEGFVLSKDSAPEVLEVEEILEKLEGVDEKQAQIVRMRYFGGMTVQEVAEELGISKRTVESEWTMIRAWLRREFATDDHFE